jgi:hypothetical protein
MGKLYDAILCGLSAVQVVRRAPLSRPLRQGSRGNAPRPDDGLTLEDMMQIYITDKTGRKFWNTNVAAGFASGERHNLERHLCCAKAGKRGYGFLDAASVKIVEEADLSEMSDDELLNALNAR